MARTIVTSENLPKPSPYFSHAVKSGGLVFVSGTAPYSPETGQLVGETIEEQTAQALRNVLAVLEEGGASVTDVVKLTIYLAESVDPNEAYRASAEVWGMNPTAVTVLKVASLGRPEALVGVEAIAALG